MRYNYVDGVKRGYVVKVWELAIIIGLILGILAYAFLSVVGADLEQELKQNPVPQHRTSQSLSEPYIGTYTFDGEAVTDTERLQRADGYRNIQVTGYTPQPAGVNTGKVVRVQ